MPDKPHELQSSTEASIQAGTTGAGLVQQRRLQPRWGRLTANGPASAPDSYEWESLYRDNDQDWQALEDIRQGSRGSYTVERESDPHDDLLLDPAVEANGRKAPIGSVVWLEPGKIFADEDGNKHREWIFHWDENLRPFVLKEDLIPALSLPASPDDPSHTLIVAAEWLDAPGETVTLYGTHQTGWPILARSFISLGIGRGPSTYFRGTFGWARYTPQGTQIGVDEDGPVWRGEWQIVTLYAETIAILEVSETTYIAAGETGACHLYWIDKDQFSPKIKNSLHDVMLFNTLQMDLDEDDRIRAYYNRNMAIWMPLGPPAPAFVSCYAYATVETTGVGNDLVYVQVPLDMPIFADPAAEDFHAVTDGDTGHSLELDLVNKGIKNIGATDLVVAVAWTVTAQRVITEDDDDIDSYCQVQLRNDGEPVGGCSSRMSSSRRRAVGEGKLAVNSISGTTRQLLKTGELLTLWIMKNESYVDPAPPNDESPNDWITVPTMCKMTVETVRDVVLEETP